MAKFKTIKKDSTSKHILAERLLLEIDKCKSVSDKGNVSFSPNFSLEAYQDILQDNIDFIESIPQSELKRIIWHSLVNSAKEGPITAELFLRHVNELEKEFLSRQPKRYILISEISINLTDELPTFRVGEATITFPKKLPASFLKARNEIIDKTNHALYAPAPNNYRWVRVSIASKGVGAAANAALEALQLLLGVLNISLSSTSRSSWGGRRQAVNIIMLGPIHTVHLQSGELEQDIWWYDPNYCGSVSTKSLIQHIEQIVKFWNFVKRHLAKIPYKNRLEQWIRLYNQALDEKDWSTSYVRLWQVLEAATHTTIEEKHTVTTKRVAFMYTDREFHHALLEHLRGLRNQLVHESAEKDTMETHLYILKNYVENLLFFHLNNAGQFNELKDIAELLDMPPSIDDLTKGIKMRKKALRFRSIKGADNL